MKSIMKSINTYINEKLVINKNFKTDSIKPNTKYELKEIIRKRLEKDKDADLNDIDVSGITDMSNLFYALDPHNIDISEWDVSNVRYMNGMFYRCKNLNCDLSNWDVSNATNMNCMFSECKNFNSDLSKWDVKNVKDISWMLFGCTSLKNKPSWYKE